MGKRKDSFKNDHRGMTLVELLCSVAIFVCITAVIGSVMVVTAKTYRSGTTEAALQEESQLAVNVIEGLIVDAGESVNYAYKVAGGTWTTIQTASEAPAGADMKLEIVNSNSTNDKVDIIYYASANRLMYQKTEAGVSGAEYLLADNVKGFGVDVSKYNDTHNVVLDMKLEKENRKFEATYNVTSRNDNVVTAEYTPSEYVDLNIGATELTLEPCETDVSVSVIATASEGTSTDFICSMHSNACAGTTATAYPAANEIRINVDKDETGSITNNMYLVVKSVAKKEDGITPLEQKVVPIYIRRVSGIDVEITQDDPAQNEYALGTTYTVSSAITGTPYLAAKPGETGYKNAYAVDWNYTLTIGGTAVTDAVRNTYFEIVEHDATNTSAAYVEVKLKKEFPAGGEFKVTGTAKHPNGVNKSNTAYDDTVVDSDKIVRAAEIPPDDLDGANFRRGTDYSFPDSEKLTVAFDYSYVKDEYKSGAYKRYFWRYREINADGSRGAWSSYRRTIEASDVAHKINMMETLVLKPDKGYELEFIMALISSDNTKLCYPYDDSLFSAGFGALGKGWKDGAPTTPITEYAKRYEIGPTTLRFKKEGTSVYTLGVGTENNPIQLNYGTQCKYDMESYFAHYGNTKASYDLKIQKWNGSAWEDTSYTSSSLAIQVASDFILFQNNTETIENLTGKFRLCYRAEGYVMTELTSTNVLEPSYAYGAGQDFDLYSITSDPNDIDMGVLYVNFN